MWSRTIEWRIRCLPVVRMHMYNLWSSKRGTSLVEILVVMVVLLVGIMTVVQLFPTGFRVVKAAESQTIATRLAQQELERWKNMAECLPNGILPIDENNTVRLNQPPGPPYKDYESDDTTGDWQFDIVNGQSRIRRGNAYNVRQVFGETTLIPVGSYFGVLNGPAYGSRYTLAFSPIDVSLVAGAIQGLSIRSGDLQRRRGDSGMEPPYLRPGQYAIDYDLSAGTGGVQVFHVAFPKDPGVAKRVYYISYSYWVVPTGGGEPELVSKVDQRIPDDPAQYVDGANGDWVEVPVEGAPSGYDVTELEDHTDSCARGFVEVPSFSLDPYEFQLADSVMGVIAFNPRGHGMYEYTARGVRPIEARIDYRIYDTRILREDRTVPPPSSGATDIAVKLALRFILNIGDPTDNPNPLTNDPQEPRGAPYEGLIPGVKMPVLIIDLATGLRVNLTDPDAINFNTGVVHLPISADLVDASGTVLGANTPLAGRHLRFFYRADGDWSVQCSKAYTTYNRVWGTNQVDFRSYRAVGAGNGQLTNRLLFAPCEGKKSVVVDYSYITESDSVEHKVSGEAHMVDMDTATGQWCVDLKVPPQAYIPANARMVVVGTSFTVRVLWRDGKNWRHVDMDTNLTRN